MCRDRLRNREPERNSDLEKSSPLWYRFQHKRLQKRFRNITPFTEKFIMNLYSIRQAEYENLKVITCGAMRGQKLQDVPYLRYYSNVHRCIHETGTTINRAYNMKLRLSQSSSSDERLTNFLLFHVNIS